jgi:glucose uptake protein
MYQPQAYAAALALMIGSMICWGSWANAMKFTRTWPFQLFYWDYVIGVVAASAVWGLTLGSQGSDGLPMIKDLLLADSRHLLYAFWGGAIFNVANLLLVAAIEIAGMATAFPIGIGLALVVGVLLNYVVSPKGNLLFLVPGVILVVLAILLDAQAYRLRELTEKRTSQRGILISIACGILMGLFYPFVAKATSGDRALGPYAVGFIFSLGTAASALIVNSLLMIRPLTGSGRVHMVGYRKAPLRWHAWGWFGGAVWCTGMVLNFVASRANIVGPAVSYAIGQGATMVSAIWGVFVWREFAEAPSTAKRILPYMFLCFAGGLILIAVAPLFP